MKTLHFIAFILLVIGGLNWGFTVFGANVVNMLLGSYPSAESAVYLLVGLSAVYELIAHKKGCRECGTAA